jgi:hypothetical protein
MAIGAIHLAWMRKLARSGCFRDLHSVIDLGPQDIQLERPVLERGLRDITPAERLSPLLDAMYVDGHVARDAQTPFYGLFGLGPYASIDVEDDRATYRLDLNGPATGPSEHDVVTNFGTTEHVFNVGEAFKSIHYLTRPGGVSLHCVPCFGFVNHGFYTINPNLLVEMARANRYEVVDFSYFDNAFVRNMTLGRDGVEGFDVAALPIQLEDMENSQIFMTKVVDLFHRNLVAAETRAAISELDPATRGSTEADYPSRKYHICFVFDLIFFAMRRPTDRAAFVMPIQNPTGVAPMRQTGSDLRPPVATDDAPRAKAAPRGWLSRIGRRFTAGR